MNNTYSVFIIHTLQAVLDPVLEFLLSISTLSSYLRDPIQLLGGIQQLRGQNFAIVHFFRVM